jgi:hypothetical protein
MSRKAKKSSKKARAKSDTKVISLALSGSGNHIVKSGDVIPGTDGDILIDQSIKKIRFEYATGTGTFALFILRFTPDPGQGGSPHESPFAARVYITDDGELEKQIKPNPKKGRYQYRLALLDGNGNLITEDPQIIVQ